MKAVCDFTTIKTLADQGELFPAPTCFLPLMGKPFIQHVVEYIERLQIQEFAVYLSQYADEIEQFLGDGERWGVKITYHLLKRDGNVEQRISKAKEYAEDELILICNALSLVLLEPRHLEQAGIFVAEAQKETPTGWRVCTKSQLLSPDLSKTSVAHLSVVDAEAYRKSVKYMMDTNGQGFIVLGKNADQGIWIGPGSKIASSSKIIPPVYIGSQVNIAQDVIVGPYAEIGNGCIIDEATTVIDSSLLEGSYLGKYLTVQGCLVQQNQVWNIALSALYRASDDILFSSVNEQDSKKPMLRVPLFSRFLALVLGLATLPILLVLYIFQRYIFKKLPQPLTVVVHPQQSLGFAALDSLKTRKLSILRRRKETQGSIYKHFWWHLIPGFWLIVANKARFFGIPYKSIEDFKKLSKDWQGLYLKSIPGIICEADVLYDSYPGEDLLFASEMYYTVMESPKYNASLFLRYVK
ncbi:MAG: NDP-sugar synthase, partial [Spirochaetia bacterium]|nr:NDP-sugar synthase [Spirochaetia bacterium]